MPVTLEAYGLDKLSLDERIALRDALQTNIEAEVGETLLTPEQMAELQRRLAHAKAHPGEGKTIEEVMETARARSRARWADK